MLEEIVATAVTDLESRPETGTGDVEVVSAGMHTFRDGSIGCPEPGMAYTQALVDGHRVVLGRDGRFFVYNAGRDDQPQLCPSDDPDLGHASPPPADDVGS